jgi:O-antigen/teichoic acid export membrane protein
VNPELDAPTQIAVEVADAAPARPVTPRHSDRAMLRAVAWTGASRWTIQLLTWVSTIVVARVLAPTDYGLVGMATIYLGLVALISEFGLGQAVVTMREMSAHQVAQLNTLSIAAGAILFAISCAVANPLGRFFHSPKLPPVVILMSISFLVSGAQVIPDALLQSDLRFKLLASFDTVRVLIQSLTTVSLALLGFGYWSLASGGVAGAVIAAAMALVARPHPLAQPRLNDIKRALGFSGDVLGSRVAWYAYSNSDFLVAGRMLGQAPLGAYTIAWTIASTPVEKITNMITRVTPAFFSAMQNDKPRLRRYLLGITEGLSLLTFPACLGMALVADQFVLVVLGPKWIAAVLPLRLLAICAAMRAITTVFPNMLFAMRHSRFVMWNTVLAAVVFPPAFYLGSRWGTAGIASAWIALYPLITAPYVWRTFAATELPVRAYLRSMLSATRACLIMTISIMAIRSLTPPTWPALAQFVITVTAGVLSYATVLLIVDRRRVRDIFQLLRRGEV